MSSRIDSLGQLWLNGACVARAEQPTIRESSMSIRVDNQGEVPSERTSRGYGPGKQLNEVLHVIHELMGGVPSAVDSLHQMLQYHELDANLCRFDPPAIRAYLERQGQ